MIKKLSKCAALVFSVCALLASCQKPVTPEAPVIKVDATEITVDAEAGSKSFNVSVLNSTDAKLVVESDSEWLTASIEDSQVNLTFTANKSPEAERSANVTLSYTGAENVVVSVKQAKGKPVIPEDAINLSAAGTANCYIVAPKSLSYFSASMKGNSTSESIGDAVNAKLVWQSETDLVKKIEYFGEEKAILIETSEKSGNALVAALDANGEILWSWHLWIVDYAPEATLYTTEPNGAGTTWSFMSRNLGAINETKGDFGSMGLFYQWGRKDPFPGAVTFTIMNDDYTYEKDGEPTLYDINNQELVKVSALKEFHGTLEKSIKNPLTFYAMTYINTGEKDEYDQDIKINDYKTGDWTDVSNDDFWGGVSMAKTIYDPCPVSYKVPVSDAEGNTPYAWLLFADVTWDASKLWCEHNSGNIWFPTTGTRVYASGTLDFPEGGNLYSGLWFGTKGKESSDLETYPDKYGQYMFIINGKRTFKPSKDKRSQGMSMRCVKEN